MGCTTGRNVANVPVNTDKALESLVKRFVAGRLHLRGTRLDTGSNSSGGKKVHRAKVAVCCSIFNTPQAVLCIRTVAVEMFLSSGSSGLAVI